MEPLHAARRRRLVTLIAGLAIAAAAGTAAAQFVLRQDSLPGGGAVRLKDANGCFRLSASVGEAVAGPASAGGLTLSSGFWGARTHPRDGLFGNSFEDCGP